MTSASRPRRSTTSRIVAALALALAGCAPDERPMVETRAVVERGVEAGNRVRVEFAGGALEIVPAPAGAPFFAADCRFDLDAMRPRLDWSEGAGRGELHLHQPDLGGTARRSRNEWRLAIGGGAPYDLELRHGIGAGRYRFEGKDLRGLTANLGNGSYTLDLRGVEASVAGTIELNSGRLELLLPPRHGVRVRHQVAFGFATLDGETLDAESYENALFEGAPVRVELNVRVMGGQLDLWTAGAPEGG